MKVLIFGKLVNDVEVKDGLIDYVLQNPRQQSDIRHVYLALRRSGIHSMEQLLEIYRFTPDQFLTIRDIGPARMELIGEILRFYKAKAPPGQNE